MPEREDWFISNRKTTIYPRCKKKEVKKLVFGMPTQEIFKSGKWYIAGCQPNMPIHRTWGCYKCDVAFFKGTDRNIPKLGGLVQWQ